MLEEKYIRWKLSAQLRGIRLSAQSITEAHRDKTLAHWKKMRAKEILVVERENVPELPTWQVEVPTSRYPVHFSVQASSQDRVEEYLCKNFKRWQVMRAKIAKDETGKEK